MIKNKIKQFKFEAPGSEKLEINDYVIKRIGIQGPPKTTFYFNGNQNNLIEIGSTGIFELDLLDTAGDITRFNLVNIESGKKVIVDILYQEYYEN